MSNYFHDLNLSKSLMDTVKAVQEGKSEEEIKNIQSKYQTEAKKPQEKFAMVDPKGKVVATGSDERDLKMERGSIADRLGMKKDDLKVVEVSGKKMMKVGDTMKESLEERAGAPGGGGAGGGLSTASSRASSKASKGLSKARRVADKDREREDDEVSEESIEERELTDAEKKKREEIAQAIERENPGMDKEKKMAIATAQAKKTEEELEVSEAKNNTKDDAKGKGKVETEPMGDKEKRGKKEPVDINPEMTKEDYKPSYGTSLESIIRQVHKRHK